MIHAQVFDPKLKAEGQYPYRRISLRTRDTRQAEKWAWKQVAKLTAEDGARSDRFGVAVALSDDTALVGAYWDDDREGNSGSAYVFEQCDPCDANCDGSVDLTDVEPFIELLLGGGQPCDACTGDSNDDGSIDLQDVELFIECLLGG